MDYANHSFSQNFANFDSLNSYADSNCNYIQEKNQLIHFCQQILQNFQLKANQEGDFYIEIVDCSIALNAITSIVDHLSDSDTEIIQFDIDAMIELNIYKVITAFIHIKRLDARSNHLSDTDFPFLLSFAHLILIWSNGTKEQNRFLFNPQFYDSIIELSQIFFYQNHEIVHFLLQSLTNLIILEYPNENDIHEITQRLFLLPTDTKPFSFSEISLIISMQEIIQCFHLIVRNYLSKVEFYNENEMNGIIVIINRWIEEICSEYLDSNNENVLKNLCSSLCCVNDIVKFKPDAAPNFYTKTFVVEYLPRFLHSSDLFLKMCSIDTLKYILTVQTEGQFDGWMLMNSNVWRSFEEVTDYEVDYHQYEHNSIDKSNLNHFSTKKISSYVLKECFIESVSYIISHLPITPIKYQQTKQIQIPNPFQLFEKETKHNRLNSETGNPSISNQLISTQIDDKLHKIDDNELYKIDDNESHQIDDNEPHKIDDNEPHTIDDNELHTIDDSDYDDNSNSDEIIYEKDYGCIIQLYEEGILNKLVDLSSLNESFRVRTQAILAIAKCLQYCAHTEIDNFIYNGCISIFLNSFDFFESNDIEIILKGLIILFNHIEHNPSRSVISKCIKDFVENDAEMKLENLNALHDCHSSELIDLCIANLSKLVQKTNLKNKSHLQNEKENAEFLEDYEEDDG